MNIVSSTKLRNNLASTLRRAEKEKYLLISRRGRVKLAIVNFGFLMGLLHKVNREKWIELEELRKGYEEVYK